MKKGAIAIILILLCVVIAIVPLLTIRDSEFGGADGEAEDIIAGEINPDYEPWAESLIEPPGGETESLLFCIQAAFGAGIIGLAFGYLIGRAKGTKAANT